jgi:hypothetical protein
MDRVLRRVVIRPCPQSYLGWGNRPTIGLTTASEEGAEGSRTVQRLGCLASDPPIILGHCR